MYNKIYKCAAAFLFAVSVLCSCQSKKAEDGIPELKEMSAMKAPKEETDNIILTYNQAKDALKVNPADLKQYLTLATVFILEGRISGDGSYYGNAALEMLNKVTGSQQATPDQLFEAYSLKSTVLLNMHQFKDAYDLAKKGIAINGFNSGIYGALIDAEVELGMYDSAVAHCDKMLALRPDLRSYSRASYLRQIHGDNRGAIDAMKMAVEAGLPGAEQTEWARVTTGDLFLNIGSIDTAEILYKMAAVYRPNYPYAAIGMAKVAKARKQYDSAILHTEKAIKVMSDPGFIALLADFYELKGDNKKAVEIRKDIIAGLKKGQEEEKDAMVKHNATREMAQAYLSVDDLENAEKYAKADLQMRPENIDANELMAWVLFLKKDYAVAGIHADKMFSRKTRNANSMYKAAAIYAAAGDSDQSSSLKQELNTISPYVDEHVRMQAGNF